MKKLLVIVPMAALIVGCANQRVSESLTEVTAAEGREFAAEMEAQSPFKTVELRWSEAEKVMGERNRAFKQARASQAEAQAAKPEVREITGEVKRTLTTSLGGAISPGALMEAVRNPAVQVPKQLASLAGLKDVSHNVSQSAWNEAITVVDAEFVMRKERVKLQQLLRKGELIDRELRILEDSPLDAENTDPAVLAATNAWREELDSEREKWLGQMRDLFDAEYHDVRLVRDRSGLPTYADVDQPDFSDWQRWCRLTREKEVIGILAKAHAERDTQVPGVTTVSTRLGNMFDADVSPRESAVRDHDSLRREVRTLIQSWRKMKQAQGDAARLEARHDPPVINAVRDVNDRKRIFKSRSSEIEHVGVIWMMDETCWT